MKNKTLAHHYQATKMYKQHYKQSFNPFRLLKSILAVFISGSAPVAHHPRRK